ncbi:fructosamine-3-kinase isoform X3 [Rattus norvegicus]|uniref:fructosamine-3-kinase isoform X3 n=1 Tax=Rattus norvegicus TaxID=10116 RepID=UPI0019177EA5|nr:fructosamine-3-kinase isoform X4 [Rattus norvegicus]
MEQLLRAQLHTKTLRAFGSSGGGCISEGYAYYTDTGPVFVKVNRRAQARQMFEGEMASLEALRNTGLVRVPKPMKVIDLPGGGAVFVMEHLKMKSLGSQASKLGEQMADLHLYNQKLREKSKAQQNTVGCGAEDAEPRGVTKFGFHTVTCCGFIPQVPIHPWHTLTEMHMHNLKTILKGLGI